MKKFRFFESIHMRIFILLFFVILAIISAYLLNNSKREDKSKKEEKIISNVKLQDIIAQVKSFYQMHFYSYF